MILKNVLADVKALETLGLVESEGEQKERHRKSLRTDFGHIEGPSRTLTQVRYSSDEGSERDAHR